MLAKAAGATTIITSSSDEKLEVMKDKYGPDHVINYKTTPDWAVEAKRVTGVVEWTTSSRMEGLVL